MPHRLSLAAMAVLIRTRRLSPLELVDAHLAQIDRLNPAMNAFVSLFVDQARAEARVATDAAPSGPLHGVPVTIKDSFDIAGLPTLCGSRFHLDRRAETDSTAVRRLRAAGAILLGKTNCPEFLMNYETDNYVCGRTSHPWDFKCTAGGSSGGESAAIAAFCSPGGVGSDGGGSIRVPAHWCGIAGLKPTPGRVSAAGHVPEIGYPGGLLGVAGPMARSAADVRLLFSVLAGHDWDDPFSAPVPLGTPDLSQLTVGVMTQWLDTPVQPDIQAAVLDASSKLGELGFAVREFRPPGMENATSLWWFFFVELAKPLLEAAIAGREPDAHWTGTELIGMVRRESDPSAVEVLQSFAIRDRMRTSMLHQMEQCPVLLMPPCSVTASPHRTRTWDIGGSEIGLIDAMDAVTPWNLFGFPALVIPWTVGAGGMPVGVQLVGRPYAEEELLELAVRLEEVRGPLPAPPAGIL